MRVRKGMDPEGRKGVVSGSSRRRGSYSQNVSYEERICVQGKGKKSKTKPNLSLQRRQLLVL